MPRNPKPKPKLRPKPRRFRFFGDLPAELQDKIWEFALGEYPNVHLISTKPESHQKLPVSPLYSVSHGSRAAAKRLEKSELRIRNLPVPIPMHPDDLIVVTRLPTGNFLDRFISTANNFICNDMMNSDRHSPVIAMPNGSFGVTLCTPRGKVMHVPGFDVQAALKIVMPLLRSGEFFKLVPSLKDTMLPISIMQARPASKERNEQVETPRWRSFQSVVKVAPRPTTSNYGGQEVEQWLVYPVMKISLFAIILRHSSLAQPAVVGTD